MQEFLFSEDIDLTVTYDSLVSNPIITIKSDALRVHDPYTGVPRINLFWRVDKPEEGRRLLYAAASLGRITSNALRNESTWLTSEDQNGTCILQKQVPLT